MKNNWFTKGFPGCCVSKARTLFLALLVLVLAIPGLAKMYQEPKSFSLQDRPLDQVDRKTLTRIDPERLLAEDRARGKDPRRPGPLRFAVTEDVAFNLNNSGTWQNLPDGRLWRLRIHSPGAVSHNLGITSFDMPEGAKLWIYDPDRKHVEGPYTSRNRSRRGSLWTPIIEGDEIVIEVFVPTGVSQPVVSIGKVNKGYRGFGKVGLLGGSEGLCNIDVVCPEGNPWQNQIRAVTAYTINGNNACTGTLLNNTALDFRPFVLSANHCGVTTTNDDTVVAFWNFQSATCGAHGPGPMTDNQTGATFRASSAASDFVLFELDAVPDPGFNVFYAGWDASGSAPPGTVCVHHPNADVKAISFSNTPPLSTAYFSNVSDPNGNHWRAAWDVFGPGNVTAITERGSSGSCLFANDTGRCIGQLHGGPSFCGAASASLNDFYGKLSVSWTGGGTNATRLSNWLDPGNTGILAMDGDPHITTLDGTHYDFQGAGEFVGLRDAGGAEIQVRQAPISTTFNPGPDAHHGLATCVSLNTAVAARVGKRRITYQPNLSGVPDPSGLQLRVDGALTTLGPAGINLGNGGRIAQTAAPGGLEITFPDKYTLIVTPGWWASQSKWYLNISVVRTPVTSGISGASPSGGALVTGGLGGVIPPGSWLPTLPDGSSMGPMPAALHDRYVALYKKFGEAWRVTDKTSLFDYAAGTSPATFTMRNWPPENSPCVIPETEPVRPARELVAERACRAVSDKFANRSCVFDVRVTDNPGFGATYALSQRIQSGATTTRVSDSKNPTNVGESVTFIATVARLTRTGNLWTRSNCPFLRFWLPWVGKGVPTGTVQFMLDGYEAGKPVRLVRGQATWRTSDLKPGKHNVSATYIPSGGAFLPSSSPDHIHTVRAGND